MSVATCRSCRQAVVWVETVATEKKPGRKMPLDADPDNPERALKVADGNIVITRDRKPDGTPLVRYVKKGPNLYRSHFATCPQAGTWRQK